jgi:acyl-CoA synthetase (NDP forming)
MSSVRQRNLDRLLRPRHVAVIGGRDAETVATECARIGYQGPLWPVNPKRSHIRGHTCFASVDDLPEAPDAVFLAVPKEAAIDTLARLAARGAGGVVCYTAGFGETGAAGADAEARLVAAAGDMAIVGPNCYGLINYVNQVALWPFAHGGTCPGYGAAIITQSGMLSSDITMSQRSLPLAYMVSVGNQAVTRIDDIVDVLSERPEVRAFGLHIEGLKDISAFERAALNALRLGKPIVALKTGNSKLGAALTVSHTGSLSGTEDLYDALFDRLGIIRVASPAQLLETVKFLCIAGAPAGTRVAGLTCSGGGATMLADQAEKLGLEFASPSASVTAKLRALLPETATVSNPLDYTTPIWGIPEKTLPVFQTLMADPYDAAVIVQDYPASGIDESKPYYRNDTISFATATRARKLAAAVCSTLPENLDQETRDFLVGQGIAPMQGLEECLRAMAGAAWHHARRNAILAEPPCALSGAAAPRAATVLDEAAAKRRLRQAGISVPEAVVAASAQAPQAAATLGFPVALKMVSARLPHKTEAGAVRLNLSTASAVADAIATMQRDVEAYDAAALTDHFLVERMVDRPVAELLVSIRHDAQFGLAMTLASGGVLVELLADATTVLLPASEADIDRALGRLKVDKLVRGYRGGPAGDRVALIATLGKLASLLAAPQSGCAEIEINPLFVLEKGCCAVDVLMQVHDATPPGRRAS